MSYKEEKQNVVMEFNYSVQTQTLQVELIDGNPWFAAVDVCAVLDIQNPSARVKERLDPDEYLTYATRRAGQIREMLFVSESGLYGLVFLSNKPEAKRFRKWVTGEVLPSIRKTGGYAAHGTPLLAAGGGFTLAQIQEALAIAEKKEQDGKTYYAAHQLIVLLGRSRNGGFKRKLEPLVATGHAIKQSGILAGGTEKWFVTAYGLPALLSIRPNSRHNIVLIKQLQNQGGAL